jgi:urease accessory protein
VPSTSADNHSSLAAAPATGDPGRQGCIASVRETARRFALRTVAAMCNFPASQVSSNPGIDMRIGASHLTIPFSTLIAFAPASASAHIANGDGHGFVLGMLHPFGGADHLLAMTAIGLLAWQLGGRALWLLPTVFLLLMAAGGVLAFTGVALPLVELSITASVIVLGAVLALGMRAPIAAAAAIAGMFAIFHGYAHGYESPDGTAAAAYGAGFLSGTALLNAGGIAVGVLSGRLGEGLGSAIQRLGGAGMALAGIALLGRVI